jgi:hypothetical protein
MGRTLKRIQRVRPTAFCSRDFFLLHDNEPAHKAASVCQFFTQKMLNHFITSRTLQIYSALPFYVLKVENEDKRTPICGCCWLIKEGPKRGIFGSFQKLYDHAKACIYANGAYFKFKKSYVSSSCVSNLKKKISPKNVGPHCVSSRTKNSIWQFWKKVRLTKNQNVRKRRR